MSLFPRRAAPLLRLTAKQVAVVDTIAKTDIFAGARAEAHAAVIRRRRELAAERADLERELPAQLVKAARTRDQVAARLRSLEAQMMETREALAAAQSEAASIESRLDKGRARIERELQQLADPRLDELTGWLRQLDEVVRLSLRADKWTFVETAFGPRQRLDWNLPAVQSARDELRALQAEVHGLRESTLDLGEFTAALTSVRDRAFAAARRAGIDAGSLLEHPAPDLEAA